MLVCVNYNTVSQSPRYKFAWSSKAAALNWDVPPPRPSSWLYCAALTLNLLRNIFMGAFHTPRIYTGQVDTFLEGDGSVDNLKDENHRSR